MKRFLSLLVLAAVLSSALISCGGTQTNTVASDAASADNEAVSEEETTAEEIISYKNASLPDKDYNGMDFVIYTNGEGDYPWQRMGAEELAGEPLNDAMFNRNKTIGEVYNINIKLVPTSAASSDMPKVVNSGDSTFSVFFAQLAQSITFSQNGLLLDLYKVPYIDLEKDWWDRPMVRDMTIANKLFFITGDISPYANVRIFSLVFNKDLCIELGLEMPYAKVLDGTWTFDVFESYVKGVNRDLNGDGIMDDKDLWGYFSQYGNSYMMFSAGGGRVATLDADGMPQVTMDNAKNIDIISKALKISTDKNAVLMANPYVAANGNSWPAASAWFANGGSLIRSSVFEPVPRDYRTMETDFGVLPYPKFNENQEEYYTLGEEYPNVISIPATTPDAECTGIILEALAAESVSTVSKAFYDVCLNGKYVRDEESSAMLDIIFDGKVYDIGYMLDIGGFKTKVNTLDQNGDTDIVSVYASIRESAQSKLDKLVEAYMALD